MKQNMKDLAFEIEAVPQVNKPSNAKNGTPVNVKIRIRNKGQNKPERQGIISIPKIGGQVYSCEKIRLSSSDQTILSFNVIMEEDKSVKQSMQKKKRIFHIFKRGGCFGIQSDDDEGEEFYSKKQSFELMTTLSTNAVDKQTFALTKNLGSLETPRTNKITQKDFLGRCKPGGCLDPPFGEDKYSYIPKLIDVSDSKKGLSELEKNKDQDKISLKNIINVKTEDKSGYNADYKKENIQSSCPVDSNFINIKKSNSIITYPSTSSSTEFSISDKIHKKTKKDSNAKENRLSNLPNEFIETYYISPNKSKKTNNLEGSTGNIAKFNKKEKSSKISLSHLHLDVQEATNHIAQSHVQNTSGDAIEEMQPILNVSKIMLDAQVKKGTDTNILSGTNLSQPDCGPNNNKNIEAIICHEENSNNLLNCIAIPTIAGDTASRGSDSNISSIINATSNNRYLNPLNKDTNDTFQLDYDTKRPLKDIKGLSLVQNQSINSNLRNMIEFQSDMLKNQDCDSIKYATSELVSDINKSQSKNVDNNFNTIALVSSTTEIIESNILAKSNDGTKNKNIDISVTRKISSVTTFIYKQDKIEINKIENKRSNDISLQPKMKDKIDSNIKDDKVSLNKLNTAHSRIIHLEKHSNDSLISAVTIDDTVDIENQKEHFMPGSKSVLETSIGIDTANNNSFTKICDIEKLHNNITPQTKLDNEAKSINESLLFKNTDKGSLTSVKEMTLITDNIQNISDQAIQNVVKSNDNRNNLNSKCDLSLNQSNLLPTNETSLETDNFRNINEQVYQNTTISKGNGDQTNASTLSLSKSNLYPKKENTLLPNHTQDIRDQAIQNISMSQANKQQKDSLTYLPKNESNLIFTKKTTLDTSNLLTVEDQVMQNKRQTRDQIDPILSESNAIPTKETNLDYNNVQYISDKIIQNINVLKPNRSLTDSKSDFPQNQSDFVPLRESTLFNDNVQNNSNPAIQIIPILQANSSQIDSKIDLSLKESNLNLRKETILASSSSQYISDQTSQSIKILKLDRDQINSKIDLPHNKGNSTPTKDINFDNHNFQKISDHAIQNITISQSNINLIKSDLSPYESELISTRKTTLVHHDQNIRDQVIKKIYSKSDLSLNKSNLTSTKETTLVESNVQNIEDEAILNISQSNRNQIHSKSDLSLNESNISSTKETTLVESNVQNIRDEAIQNLSQSNRSQIHSKSDLSLNKSNLTLPKETTLVENNVQNIEDEAILNVSQSNRNQIYSKSDLSLNESNITSTKETTLVESNVQNIRDEAIQNVSQSNRNEIYSKRDLSLNKSNLTLTEELTLVESNVQNIGDEAIQNVSQSNRNQILLKSDLSPNKSNLTLPKEPTLVQSNVQNIGDEASQNVSQSKRNQILSKSDLSLNKSNLTLAKETTLVESNVQNIEGEAIQNISQSNRNQLRSESDLSLNKSNIALTKETTLVESNVQNIGDEASQNVSQSNINQIHSKSDLSLNESNIASTKETTLVENNVQNIGDEDIENVSQSNRNQIHSKSDLSLNESNLTSTRETTLVKSNIQNISDQSVQIITKSNGNINQMYSLSEIPFNEGKTVAKAITLPNNDIQTISDQAIQNIAQLQTNRNQIDSNKDFSEVKTSLIFTSLNKEDNLHRKTIATKEISPKIKSITSFNEKNGKIISFKESSQNNLQGITEVQLKNNVFATNEDNNNIAQSTHKENIVKDIIYLDLMFQSCAVDQNKNVVRTLDTSLFDNSHQLLGDNILHIKTLIRMDDNEIRIPIDADKDLSLKITKPQEKFSHKNRMNRDLSDPHKQSSKQKSDDTGVFLNNERNTKNENANVSTKIKDNTKSAENLQETLCSIYQEKLLPLHDIIRNLIGDVDGLAQQQSIITDKLCKVNEIQANGIPNKNKKCGCNIILL